MRLSSPAAYRLWAPYYDAFPNPILALEERMITDLFSARVVRTVIDVGCGTGRSMLCYNSLQATAFGADPCPEMLAEANKKTGISGTVVQAEASQLPFATGIADVAVCSFTLSYVSELPRALRELARITRIGGQIVISDLHPAAIGKGWTRTFRVGSETFEIEDAGYRDEEMLHACKDAGLRIQNTRESAFSEAEKLIFAAAGKEHLYSKVAGIPAVRVIVCTSV